MIVALPWFAVQRFSPTLAAVPAGMLCGYALLRPRWGWMAEIVVVGLVGLALWGRWG